MGFEPTKYNAFAERRVEPLRHTYMKFWSVPKPVGLTPRATDTSPAPGQINHGRPVSLPCRPGSQTGTAPLRWGFRPRPPRDPDYLRLGPAVRPTPDAWCWFGTWSRRLGSNQLNPLYERGTRPDEKRRQNLERLEGLEPSTSSLARKRSTTELKPHFLYTVNQRNLYTNNLVAYRL